MSKQSVEVVNYGGGNLGSLLRALERCDIPYILLDGEDGDDVAHRFPSGTRPLILPGVGAFGSLMVSLNDKGFIPHIKKAVQEDKVPFLGVCVGLQVLFESSEESPEVAGLGLLSGKVKKFVGAKVPQIGWNYVHPQKEHWPEGYVYYVNSYYAQPENPNVVLYQSSYQQQSFCGAIHHKNMTAFQFHPEKSGAFGHDLISYWYESLRA